MNSLRTLLVIAAIAFVSADSIPFSTCGGDGSVTVQSVNVDPYPVQAGKDVNVAAAATGTKTLTGGQAKVTVKLGFVPVLTKSIDICTVNACPIAPGPVTLKLTEALPDLGIHGVTVKVDVAISDQDSKEVACVEAEVKVGASTADEATVAENRMKLGITEEMVQELKAKFELIEEEMAAADYLTLGRKGLN